MNCSINCKELKYGVCPPMLCLCPKKLKDHDAKVRQDAIEELLNNVSESIIWDILAEVMKRNIGASDGADKIIDYLQKVAEQLKGEQKMFDKGLKTEEVKKMLEERNVSVREFSDATNTTETAMNWYLSGKRIPRGPIVVNMATFLGCKIEDIYI